MLAVRVDPARDRVALLERVGVAGRDPSRKTAVPLERDHFGSARASQLGRPVGRAVVDDEHVGVGQTVVKLLEDRRQALLLVPGRDEDEELGASLAARSATLR